jgi:DNA-binding NarL/FixJ family response regulator
MATWFAARQEERERLRREDPEAFAREEAEFAELREEIRAKAAALKRLAAEVAGPNARIAEANAALGVAKGERDRIIAEALAAGLSYRMIAEAAGVTFRTVERVAKGGAP